MTKLRVNEAAAFSIVEQADYYAERGGTELALRWEAGVDEAIFSLLRWPEIGSPCRFRSPKLAGMRWISVRDFQKHLILYRYSQAEDTVFIVQVLHGARDIDFILGDEEDTK